MKYLIGLLLLITSASVLANKTVLFEWTPTYQLEDGTVVSPDQLSGYTVYKNGEQLFFAEGGDTNSKSHDVDYGEHCFAISTTDIYGQEGEKSPELCAPVFPAPPAAPVLRLN